MIVIKLPTIPKEMANQSVVLKLKTGEVNNWGKEEYEKISIEHCVVQPQTIYSGSNNNRQIVANAIVFFYAKITSPMPVLNPKHVGSTLNFEGKDYSITQITDNRDPYSNEVWSYELEVL
nr:putative minor capsid protein [Companilactobacillus suantsaicola]